MRPTKGRQRKHVKSGHRSRPAADGLMAPSIALFPLFSCGGRPWPPITEERITAFRRANPCIKQKNKTEQKPAKREWRREMEGFHRQDKRASLSAISQFTDQQNPQHSPEEGAGVDLKPLCFSSLIKDVSVPLG